jgi:hypothetical protein
MKNERKLKSSTITPSRKTIGVLRTQYIDLLQLREKVRLLEKANENVKGRRSARGQLSIVA